MPGFGNYATGKEPRPLTKLQRVADTEYDECHECETLDYEDHTFAGMMFVVECPSTAAVEVVHLKAVWVRGELGPMTVWWTEGGWQGKSTDESQWHQVFGERVRPSFENLAELRFAETIPMRPGETIGLYVHSGTRSDTGLVYDNQRSQHAGRGPYLIVHPGRAHLAPRPFAGYHPWGAFRDRRHFVGKISFSVKHLLWHPTSHSKFPMKFRNLVRYLLLARQRPECPLAVLPQDVIFFILHLLHPSDGVILHEEQPRSFFFRQPPSSGPGGDDLLRNPVGWVLSKTCAVIRLLPGLHGLGGGGLPPPPPS